MAQDITSILQILKEKHLGPALKTWYFGVPELQMFDKRPPEGFGGKTYLQSLYTKPNESAGPRAEGALLPVADVEDYQQLSIPRTHYYARGTVTGPAISAASSAADRLLDMMMAKTDGVLDSIRNRLSQHFYGDGTAALANVVAGTLSTTQASVDSVKYLRVGMPINIGQSDGTNAEDTTITAITPATATAAAILTYSTIAAAPVAGTDVVYPVGASATGGAGTALTYNRAIDGLSKIVDDNNVYAGITRSTSTDWANSTVRNASAGLTPDFVWDILNELRTRGGGLVNSMPAANKLQRYIMLCSNETFRAVGNMFYASRIWNDNIRKISGIVSAFDMDGVDVVWTRNCPKTDAYIIDREHMHWLEEESINMSDMTGSIWQQDDDLDQFQCWAKWRGNLYTSLPNVHARLTNIPITSYY